MSGFDFEFELELKDKKYVLRLDGNEQNLEECWGTEDNSKINDWKEDFFQIITEKYNSNNWHIKFYSECEKEYEIFTDAYNKYNESSKSEKNRIERKNGVSFAFKREKFESILEKITEIDCNLYDELKKLFSDVSEKTLTLKINEIERRLDAESKMQFDEDLKNNNVQDSELKPEKFLKDDTIKKNLENATGKLNEIESKLNDEEAKKTNIENEYNAKQNKLSEEFNKIIKEVSPIDSGKEKKLKRIVKNWENDINEQLKDICKEKIKLDWADVFTKGNFRYTKPSLFSAECKIDLNDYLKNECNQILQKEMKPMSDEIRKIDKNISDLKNQLKNAKEEKANLQSQWNYRYAKALQEFKNAKQEEQEKLRIERIKLKKEFDSRQKSLKLVRNKILDFKRNYNIGAA